MIWQECHRSLLKLAEMGDLLTKSQQEAYEFIYQAVANYEQRINLWGNPGSGKTFLGHYLHFNKDFSYFHNIEAYRRSGGPESNSVVIIDNAPHERRLARVIFGDVFWKSNSNVILITREPIIDAIRRINLSLTDDDIKQIQKLIEQMFNVKIMGTPDNYAIQRSGIWALLKDVAAIA